LIYRQELREVINSQEFGIFHQRILGAANLDQLAEGFLDQLVMYYIEVKAKVKALSRHKARRKYLEHQLQVLDCLLMEDFFRPKFHTFDFQSYEKIYGASDGQLQALIAQRE